MPTNEDRDESVDTEQVEEPEVEEETQPREFKFDVSDLDNKIANGIERAFGNVFQRQAAQNAPADPEITPQTISEDDDDSVRIEKTIHNKLIPLKRQMGEFREFGLSRLAQLTESNAEGRLPYYNDYKGEISAELAKLQPAFRSDPNTIKLVYDTVVMRHMDEIVEKRSSEKARAALNSTKPPAPAGGRSSREVNSENPDNHVPTPDELFDEEQVAMINERGGPDAFAKRVSGGRFNDWNEYAASRERLAKQPRNLGRPVIPFRRLELKKGTRGRDTIAEPK